MRTTTSSQVAGFATILVHLLLLFNVFTSQYYCRRIVAGAEQITTTTTTTTEDGEEITASGSDSGSDTNTRSLPYISSIQATSKMYDGVYSSASPVDDIKLCPWYGCSHLPRDIYFDEEMPSALGNIRQFYASREGGGEEEGEGEAATTAAAAAGEDTNAAMISIDDSLGLLRSIGNDNHATLTLVGYKGGEQKSQVNQDRSFIISPYMGMLPSVTNDDDDINKDDTSSSSSSSSSQTTRRRLLGVFDGHGHLGEFVSDHTVTKLPALIASKFTEMNKKKRDLSSVAADDDNDDEAVKKIIFDSFVEMDRTAPQAAKGGCTATIVLQLDNKIYIGNTGDSRSLIATHRKSTGDVEIVYVTREDKPDLPDEKARVEKMGGRVRLGSVPRVMYVDPESGREWGLAMSRSIGDWDAGEVGVIPDPIVDSLSLEDLTNTNGEEGVCVEINEQKICSATSEEPVPDGDIEVFAVSATDGLLDYVSVEIIAEHVAKGLYATDGPHLINACEDLIGFAARGWSEKGRYRDDIAIAVSRLT